MSEWIKCNDKLPELTRSNGLSSERVLVAQGKLVYFGYVGIKWIKGCRYKEWRDFYSNDPIPRPELITHWMPEPKPPEVDSD